MNRFIANLPADRYRADDVGESVPTLSSSIASEMVEKSPWHAWRLHPKLGGKIRKSTDSMDDGQLMHAFLLGQESTLTRLDVDDFRTNAAKTLRSDAIALGKMPVKKADYDAALEHAARIDNALRKQCGIELGRMQRELTAVWSQKTNALGQVPADVLCRARLDIFDGTTIYDIKTTTDARKSKLEKSVINFGYHVQAATYIAAVEHVEPRLSDRVRFVLLFIENETSAVVPYPLDSTFLEMGRQRWQECVNAWQACLSSGDWPAYVVGEHDALECPEWYKFVNDAELHSLRRKVERHVR